MDNSYQWEKLVDEAPKKRLHAFLPDTGVSVLTRDNTGKAEDIRIRLYTHTKRTGLYVIGPFNSWGTKSLDTFQFQSDGEGYYSVDLSGKNFKHKTPYLIVDRGIPKRDPSSVYFNKEGHSIFWDFGDSTTYEMKTPKLDRINRSVKILQTDLPGLITHFRGEDGKLGHEHEDSNYYKFITNSGVIQKIKDLGFNTIQFLPVSQSIDGDKWSFRYLVPYLYSISNRWGDPDAFAEMVDTFHANGIAVILDHVISHVPHKRFRMFDIPNKKVGIHRWEGDNHESIFLGEETSWGTKRYQFHNPEVRGFVVQSALSLMKNYGIDGFRIDNVDGILRHGMNGDGADRHGGVEILRDLAQNVYTYDPTAYIHLESHYFHGDNAKMLTLPLSKDDRALGATAYTSSRLTYYLHREFMPKSAEEISPWKIKDLIEEKEWGGSNSTVADFHNHDAAAGLIPMRATGSYAYDALLLGNPSLHVHAIGKIKVMESLISFGMEGRTLDLLQTHLLQTGTFEHDSSIYWFLEQIEANKAVLDYKQAVNKVLDSAAFWPSNVGERKYSNVHEDSKTLTIFRSSGKEEHFIVLVNLAGHTLFDFCIPVPKIGEYELILNSDNLKYGGLGTSHVPSTLKAKKVDLFEHFSHGLKISTLSDYTTLVFKKMY